MNEYCERDGELYYGNDLVATFVPEIKCIDVLKNQVTNKFSYRYHIWVKKEVPEHEEVFDSLKDIPFHEYWKKCVGMEILSTKQKKLLNEYLLQCAKSAHKNEIPCFGGIEELDDINSTVEWSELADYLIELLSLKQGEGEILLLAKMAAILKPLFGEKDTSSMDFYFIILGRSGIGKTTLAKLFFCQSLGQCRSFKLDNQNSIEEALKKYPGDTILVDDYHLEALDYGKKKQSSIKDLISRMANRPDTAMAVVTAEFREGIFSTQDREVQIEISNTQIQWSLLENCKQKIYLYKTLLYRICCEIYKNRKTIQEMIADRENKAGQFRISYNVNILKTVVDIMFYIFDEMPLGEFLKKRMPAQIFEKEHFYRLLDELEVKQKKSMEFVGQNECRIDWIKCFYNMEYKNRIFCRVPIDEMNKNGSDGNRIYLDGDKIYISEMTLIDGMKMYFNYSEEKMAETRMMARRLINSLKLEKILLNDASGSNTKKKKGKRFYVIDRERLEMFCQCYIRE